MKKIHGIEIILFPPNKATSLYLYSNCKWGGDGYPLPARISRQLCAGLRGCPPDAAGMLWVPAAARMLHPACTHAHVTQGTQPEVPLNANMHDPQPTCTQAHRATSSLLFQILSPSPMASGSCAEVPPCNFEKPPSRVRQQGQGVV